MKKIYIILATLAIAVSAMAEDPQKGISNIDQIDQNRGEVGLPIENGLDESRGEGETSPPKSEDPPQQQYVPPAWETRQGIEVAAKSYFQAKAEFISCRCRGDKPGMARAAKRMKKHSSALADFKKQQATRDNGQDARLNKHSELVWKHESQINGKGGINDRLGKTEKAVDTLEKEVEAVTPAIAGVDGKIEGLTWWVLLLTLVVLIGFTRRFWIIR